MSFALAANDLGVHLVGTGVEQLYGFVLQIPQRAVIDQVGGFLYPLARNQLRGFNSYGLGLCHYRRLYCAGRQGEVEQPNHEQACCCA